MLNQQLGPGEQLTDEKVEKLFEKLTDEKINLQNDFYLSIQSETAKMFSYLEEKIKTFPTLFDKNLTSLKDTCFYLESTAIKNKSVCAGIIDEIPGWTCSDCSDVSNSIYCSECYLKCKDLHKGHNVCFCPSSYGMCDCGDPNAFDVFCPDHKGPLTDQKQINEYIEKSFSSEVLSKLKTFFDDLFLQFSKFFILTEKCDVFCAEVLMNKVEEISERKEINKLNKNFCILFQNLLNFIFPYYSKEYRHVIFNN